MTEQIPGGPAPSDPNAVSPPVSAEPPGGAPAGPPPGHTPPPPGYAPPPAGAAPQGPPPGNVPPPPPGYAPPPAGAAPQGPPPQGPPPGYPPPPPGYAPPPGGYPPPPAPGYPGAQGGYAPPPAAGYPGAPGQPAAPGGGMQFDASKATMNDWIVIGAGAVLLIFSFFGWVSLGIFGSVGAWNQYWWIATVLGVAVAVIFALRVLFAQPLPQIKPMVLGIGAAVGAAINLIALIQILVSYSAGFSVWLCLIVALAQTYFVWMWGQKQQGWTLPKVPGSEKM